MGHNLVLVFALATSATVTCLLRRDARNMGILLAILVLCAISFLLCLNAYTSGSPWQVPSLADLRVHSYSLFREKIVSPI
jgi:hypothetical protein